MALRRPLNPSPLRYLIGLAQHTYPMAFLQLLRAKVDVMGMLQHQAPHLPPESRRSRDRLKLPKTDPQLPLIQS